MEPYSRPTLFSPASLGHELRLNAEYFDSQVYITYNYSCKSGFATRGLTQLPQTLVFRTRPRLQQRMAHQAHACPDCVLSLNRPSLDRMLYVTHSHFQGGRTAVLQGVDKMSEVRLEAAENPAAPSLAVPPRDFASL
jgi:hypothetical protein